MRRKSIVLEKATSFSLAIIGLYRNLTEAKEFVISKQLLKSGTAIGANISEALAAESTKDFIHKMSLASKESRETYYWLHILQESQLVKTNLTEIMGGCNELICLLTSIVKTSSLKLNTKN